MVCLLLVFKENKRDLPFIGTSTKKAEYTVRLRGQCLTSSMLFEISTDYEPSHHTDSNYIHLRSQSDENPVFRRVQSADFIDIWEGGAQVQSARQVAALTNASYQVRSI